VYIQSYVSQTAKSLERRNYKMDLDTVLKIVSGLVGFPALLSVLLDAAKRFGWLQDGQAPYWNFGAQLVVYLGVGVAVMLGKVELIPNIDQSLSAASQLVLALLAFLSSLGIAKGYHAALRGVPVIGYSHPKDLAQV
jgi:hypothetical protein